MSDTRYKIGIPEIRRIKYLRRQNLSWQKIADKINEEFGKKISWGTAYYWGDDEHREKAKKTAAARKIPPEEYKRKKTRILERRNERWEENPNLRLAHEIRVALAERRVERKSVRGIPIEECRRLQESGELLNPNSKLHEAAKNL